MGVRKEAVYKINQLLQAQGLINYLLQFQIYHIIQKIIDKFITYQFEPQEVKKSSEYPDSIFWIKNGEVIAEINNTKYFWVESQIWNTISSMFSLKHSETQQVIKDWLEENYKLGGLTPWKISNTKLQSWKHIKLD